MKNIFKIIKLSKPQHAWIAVVSLLILVQAVLQQATPITLKYVVDELSNQISTGTGNFQTLSLLFIFILLINLSGVLLNSINQRLGDHMLQDLADI